MILGSHKEFGDLNIFRYGAIAKTPPSGHGVQFTKYGIVHDNPDNVMSTPMLLNTLVQFRALNIFRYGAIAKVPP